MINVTTGIPAATEKVAVTMLPFVFIVMVREPTLACVLIWIGTESWVGPFTDTVPTVIWLSLKVTVVTPCTKLVKLPLITIVGLVPSTPKFGFAVAEGAPAATEKAVAELLATSLPVVNVTVRLPMAAPAAIAITAVAEVALFTVSEVTVTPLPKLAVVVPCTQCVDWPVIEIKSAVSPWFPLPGLTFVI